MSKEVCLLDLCEEELLSMTKNHHSGEIRDDAAMLLDLLYDPDYPDVIIDKKDPEVREEWTVILP